MSDGHQQATANRPLLDLTLIVVSVLMLALALSLWLRRGAGPDERGGVPAGQTAPPIEAAGWINGDVPTVAEREGKVVVVNAWFTTCPYCKLDAPNLIKAYKAYREDEVIFLGLTFEDETLLPAIKQYLKQTGISWPNGYGARQTLANLEAEYFPATWVIGRDGKIVWNSDSPGELADGIELALAAD